MVKMLNPGIRIEMKCDLRDFECGLDVGARQTGMSISETADLLGCSCTNISRVYRQSLKRKKESSSFMSKNALLTLMLRRK